jgi:hypothetical protein
MNMEFIYMKQALKMPAYEEIVRKAAVSDSVVANQHTRLLSFRVLVSLRCQVYSASGERARFLSQTSTRRFWEERLTMLQLWASTLSTHSVA